MYLRFAAALAALGAGVAGIVVVIFLLSNEPGPTSLGSGTTTQTPTSVSVQPSSPSLPGGRIATPDDPGFPSPPPGALVLSREAGAYALAIAVKPGLVRVSVLSPRGGGQRGLKVSVRIAGGEPVATKVCGSGCYQAAIHGAAASPVTVELNGASYPFLLPSGTTDGSSVVDKATATWRALHTLVWHEQLASSPINSIRVVYRAIAPNELSYDVNGRSSAVIIGSTRWDRPSPGAKWQRSPQDPELRQPIPFWVLETDARIIGTARVDGHAVWRVTFFDPETPAWFDAYIDKSTSRTLELRMIAAAHFMHDVYGPFNSAIDLSPPH